ncbi:hypothetical protein CDV31_008187 [Fusarium ambrosium]|uniref:Heterokaryon incompatibility domain-containing protein n=1 Tax=Fusarium ambrosium TaxID=131363 RepID=A0A428U279_9HYPO|nr:hypothetical protein CDV31_008187 [Fusarium ambrosium]
MSRWHKSSCNSPKVSVAGGLPCCESCGSSPNIPTLISEQAGYDPPWAMPPDEKFGEMNLFWPDPSLYSPQSQATAKVGSKELNKSDTGEEQDAPSPIYTRRLKDDEFRLLCLSAANDDTQPIHASLEAYRTDDCPEYEAVSYCWGGENGDSTLCKPVFLGDYWDVLLQTRNCWSMLRYLRSRVGARIIWVDAICIQQKDHQERESQVTMMGNIYERCLRAIVYLGEDVVRPPSHNNRAYPARRDLNKVSAAAVDLHQVLKMRYFQRVWVIQELIQAPMVVIPIRGVELIAGRCMANPKEVAWDETDAPWMRHICTGQSDPALTMILRQTSNSQSTDPRDKVFGLLGFLPETKKLRPNYLLSSLHIYIGTIAYMLLNEGHSLLLTEAAGHQAPPTVPSWLPDGNLSNLGVLLQKLASSASISTSRKNTSFWKKRDRKPLLFKTVYDVVSTARDLRKNTKWTLERIQTRIHPLDPDIVIGHILGLFRRLYINSVGPFIDLYFNFLQHFSPGCSMEIEESGKETWLWVTMHPRDWFTAHESLNDCWYDNAFGISAISRSPDYHSPWFWARVPGCSDPIHEELETLEINYSSTTHQLSSWTTSDGRRRRTANAWDNSQTVTMVASEEALRRWLEGSSYFELSPRLKICSRLVGEDEMTLAATAPKSEYRSICYYDWPDCFFDGEHIPGKQENITIF